MSEPEQPGIEQKPKEWRERADSINAEEREHTDYWNGVRSAYRELADEIERSLSTESEQ